MRQVLLLVLAMLLIGTDFSHRDTESTEIEIVIVKAPSQPRHPYQDEYERMLYPTVRISSSSGTGSGVVIATTDIHSAPVGARAHASLSSQIAQIITAAHVVENQSVVDIELYNLESITGTVVITDTVKDIALIKAEINTDSKTKIYTAKLADKDYTPYLFAPVWTVGCSLGLNPRPSSGHITAINNDSWEVSSPILPGNSGGPVYDARTYEVIGIAVWVKVCQGQLVTTMAGIVPINQIYEFLDSHRDTEVTEKHE